MFSLFVKNILMYKKLNYLQEKFGNCKIKKKSETFAQVDRYNHQTIFLAADIRF